MLSFNWSFSDLKIQKVKLLKLNKWNQIFDRKVRFEHSKALMESVTFVQSGYAQESNLIFFT